jgi:hypothetical protein
VSVIVAEPTTAALVALARVQLAAPLYAPLLAPPPREVPRAEWLAWLSPACQAEACHDCEWPSRCRCACEHGEPLPGPAMAPAPARRTRPPLRPCGTYAAYRRHKRRGEPADEACREACQEQVRKRKAS